MEHHEPDTLGRDGVLLQLSQRERHPEREQRAFSGQSSVQTLPGVSFSVPARQFPPESHRVDVRSGAVQQRCVAHHGVHAGVWSAQLSEEQLLDVVGLSLTLALM
jgi:hypothetical protein